MEIIIIDDECLVLEGLRVLISTFDTSINIKCFLDANEALQYVKVNKPDIIVSDIQMPKMDGLALCQKIRQLCKAEIIIISGYESFAYAKKAVELGALSYVLKPINQKEFIEVLKTAIGKIEKDKFLNNLYAVKNRIIKSKVLSDIANGFNNATLIKDELSELCDNQVFDHYTISIMILDDAYLIPSFQNNDEFENTYKKLYKIMDAVIKISNMTVYFSEAQPGKFIFLCMAVWEEAFGLLKNIAKQIKEKLDIGTTIGLSNQYENIYDIFIAYDEALSAFQKEFMGDNSQIYTYNKELILRLAPNLHKKQSSFNLKKLNYYQNIFCSIIVGDNNDYKLTKAADTLFEDIKVFSNSFEDACRFCEELSLLIISSFFKTFEHNSLTSDDIIKFCNTIQLKETKLLSDLKISFIKSSKALALIVQNKISHKSDTILIKVDKLLSEDCSTITLQGAADYIGLNPTYFSILFKQKSGKNFKDYVLDYKIGYAKKMLLDPSKKISEISQKIGYPDSNYFAKIFKKYTGKSPSDFRNNVGEFEI